ncbi:MAG: hypothetical protein CK526_05810 [Thaumarchaeota archaeon]|nr:MAG: hypothetical protein CK526_05810 [Nitrososphaerota archaeon]
MLKIIILIMCIGIIGGSSNLVYSQEIGLSTFQESAQLIIDNKITNKTSESITLTSTNIQEIIILSELEQKIRDNKRIQAIVLTNENDCVLGVTDQSCILINIERNPEDKGIFAIQDNTRIIADSYIDGINQMFDTDAKFFQVYIHTSAESNEVLDTSGIISGSGIISAVYTMPMEDTDSMYEKISTMLVSKQIRDSGGFYNIARNLATEENAKMTFSIIPTESKTLSQLRVSVSNPTEITMEKSQTDIKINPLQFFKIKDLNRSEYFSKGNYPLNSIFQIVILSNEDKTISNINGNIIPTQTIDGIEIPTEITKKGWVFDPKNGMQIQGKYIFGESTSINENELKFSLVGNNPQSNQIELDESIVVVIIIAIVSIGAAIFYLKGYKK